MFTMYSLKRNKFMPLDHHMHICLIKRNMYVMYVICRYVCQSYNRDKKTVSLKANITKAHKNTKINNIEF